MQISAHKALSLAALLLVSACQAWAVPDNDTVIKVMTQNMDAGTDLKFALAYLNTATPTVGIDLTFEEIQHSNFKARAAILAKQIAAAKPDIVALQEATLWSTGPDAAHQTALYDQLTFLTEALGAIGENYSLVDVNELTRIALPMSNGVWLGFLDRDVILARNAPGLVITNPRKKAFEAALAIPSPLGDIPAPQGWMAADVTLNSQTFTVVNTHLQSTMPGQPEVTQLQAAQAQELAQVFGSLAHIIVAGDFNSNATHTPPEQTPSVAVMLSAGFTDTWPAVNHGIPGFTWPLYVEDPLAAHPKGPFERIDFVFHRGFSIQAVDRIGWKAPHASDHAGVIATFEL